MTWLLLLHPISFFLAQTEFPRLALCPGVTLTRAINPACRSLGNDCRWNEPILFWLAETLISHTFWHLPRHHKTLLLFNKVYFWMIIFIQFGLALCIEQRDVWNTSLSYYTMVSSFISAFWKGINPHNKDVLEAPHLVNCLLSEHQKLISHLV